LQQLNTKTKFSAPQDWAPHSQIEKKIVFVLYDQFAREGTDEKVHTKKFLSSFYKHILGYLVMKD
jgi:hypothetical protein